MCLAGTGNEGMRHPSCQGYSQVVPGVTVGPVSATRPQEATWSNTHTPRHMHVFTGVHTHTHTPMFSWAHTHVHTCTCVHTHTGSLPHTLHHSSPLLVEDLATLRKVSLSKTAICRHHSLTGHRKAQNSHPGASWSQQMFPRQVSAQRGPLLLHLKARPVSVAGFGDPQSAQEPRFRILKG